MGKYVKISDKEFLTLLRENSGLFARTAKAIRKQFKIEYSRQAVQQRAESFPEEYADIIEENIDVAEDGLYSLMQSKNENVKLRAIEIFLRTRGKKRGYVERQEHDLSGVPPTININVSSKDNADKLKKFMDGK